MLRPVTKVYAYKGCDTCRKALKWLRERGIDFEELAIRETPPQPAELEKVLQRYDGDLRRLFNTAGGDYRSLGMKDRLPDMAPDEAIALLAAHGNLVKRPLVVGKDVALAGFKTEEWNAAFSAG